jgi:hypothetical protein
MRSLIGAGLADPPALPPWCQMAKTQFSLHCMLAGLLLAGCGGPAASPPDVVPPLEVETACWKACVPFEVEGRRFAEPSIATRGGVMLLGVNEDLLTTSPTRLGPYGTAFFVANGTEGGWREVYPQEQLAGIDYVSSSDPLVAIDDAGHLHIAYLVISRTAAAYAGGTAYDIYYAESQDLGITWRGRLVTTDGQADRPWMALDDEAVILTWQDPLATTRLAYIRGDDVRIFEHPMFEGCAWGGPIQRNSSEFLFSCRRTGDRSIVRIFSFSTQLLTFSREIQGSRFATGAYAALAPGGEQLVSWTGTEAELVGDGERTKLGSCGGRDVLLKWVQWLDPELVLVIGTDTVRGCADLYWRNGTLAFSSEWPLAPRSVGPQIPDDYWIPAWDGAVVLVPLVNATGVSMVVLEVSERPTGHDRMASKPVLQPGDSNHPISEHALL